jgi:IS5 family transposase
MPALLLPVQQLLQPALPTIEGNVDYQRLRQQLLRIDQLLLQSGAEAQFIAQSFEDWKAHCKFKNISAKAQRRIQVHARRALRCNIARTLLMEDFRGFAIRLADSPLFQHFCAVAEIDRVQVPAKSTLQRYSQWCEEAAVRRLVDQITQQAHLHPQKLRLRAPLDLDACFLDTTCLKANIHYPVDWVLLRDATRTLMKAVTLIRTQGLRHRMEEPALFLRRMNILCMEMTHARGKTDSQKQRKKVLRKMDKLVGGVARHAQRYRQLLDQQWEQTEWTRGETECILRRLDNVLGQLPAARQQARERILQGQLVASQDKILSLYEPDVQVIVRHKAGAEVEFGNTLLLGESPQGVILDWELFQEVAPNDARLVSRSLKRIEENLHIHVKAVGGDRGFDSETNQQFLKKRKTYNGLCPRSVKALKQRKRSPKFNALQRRRSQCEGRIGIVKNNFLGRPLRNKGFASRELAVSWAVLTHNLWVIARLPERKARSQAKPKPKPLALAA